MVSHRLYVVIDTDPSAWGVHPTEFDAAAEASRLQAAAEAAGIEVFSDCHSRPGDESRMQLNWFDQWCREGHEWTDQQWRDWFTVAAAGSHFPWQTVCSIDWQPLIVSANPNRAAHGGVCHCQIRRLTDGGLQARQVNSNGGNEEIGETFIPTPQELVYWREVARTHRQ